MLILSRRIGEKVVIGNDIEITVERIYKGHKGWNGLRVALGFTAPKGVRIRRSELEPREQRNEL